MMAKFKAFLITEEKSYLGKKVSTVLTSLEDLQQDMENLGSRHLGRLAEQIVSEIRKILHGNWSEKSLPHLKELQKIAVAIQKTISDRGDLREVLPAAVQAIQELTGKLGIKMNNLELPEAPGEDNPQMELTPPPQNQMPQPGQNPDTAGQAQGPNPLENMPNLGQPGQMRTQPGQI